MRVNNQPDPPSVWFGVVWYKASNKIWQKLHEVLHVNASLTSITPSPSRGDFRQITQILKASPFSSENKDHNHHILALGRRSKADIKGLEESFIPAFSQSACLGLCILPLKVFLFSSGNSLGKTECLLFVPTMVTHRVLTY